MSVAEPQAKSGMEAVFLEHLELIERVASYAGRRGGFPPQDVEDFVSTVKVKLIDDDYAVLRKHRGDSSLATYLTTVVHNLFKDFCNHKLGKFRPSAKAKRLGPTALALERLLVRDQHELESAIRILKTRYAVDASDDEIRELAAQLPPRSPRREVGDEVLEQRAAEAPEADAARRVEDDERSATADRVEGVLNLALESLSTRDLLVLKMHFRDGCTIAAIAAALHEKQRQLYTLKENCLRQLRAVLDGEGLTWDEVREILGWQGREVRADFGNGGGNRGGGSV